MAPPELSNKKTAVLPPPEAEHGLDLPPVEHRLLDAVRRHRRALAFAAFAMLGLLANYPTWPGDPSRIATCLCGGNGDPAQTVWFLAWTPFALLHGQSMLVSSWINLPAGADLAQNTSMPLLGLLTAPVTLAMSPVASENLLRWLAFPLSAYAMYWVLRRWVRWEPAAFAGGLLYGFSPYMVSQASVHLNLSFVPLPPLIFYVCNELVVRQQRSALRSGLLLGVLAIAQFYISAEVLATTALTAVVATVLLVVLGIRRVPRHALHALVGLGIGAFVLSVGIAYPLYLMTHGALHYLGPPQGRHEVFNADLLGPVLPTVSELVAPHRLATIGTSLVGGRANIDENGSYLGIPLLALLAYLALRYWRRRWIPFAFLMGGTMFLFSLGPVLDVGGKHARLPFQLPFAHLQHLPLIEDVLPARFALYVTLFASAVLALGLDAFHDGAVASRWRARPPATRRRTHRVAVLAGRALGAVVLLGAVVALLPRWPYRSRPATPPAAASRAELASVPAGGAVLTYPYATPFTDDAMLWQAIDQMRFKIFGSYILRRGAARTATPLPAELSPLDVQAMLSDTLSPIAMPGEPYLAPTDRTIVAARIVVAPVRTPASPRGAPAVTGIVENVDPATGAFYVITHGLGLVGVTLTPTTLFDERRPVSPVLRVVRAERVVVYGKVTAGTLTPHRVADLRTFLRAHRVAAVVVELARVDSLEVATWVRDAIGPPSRTLASGEVWLHVPRLVIATRHRPELARRTVGTVARHLAHRPV